MTRLALPLFFVCAATASASAEPVELRADAAAGVFAIGACMTPACDDSVDHRGPGVSLGLGGQIAWEKPDGSDRHVRFGLEAALSAVASSRGGAASLVFTGGGSGRRFLADVGGGVSALRVASGGLERSGWSLLLHLAGGVKLTERLALLARFDVHAVIDPDLAAAFAGVGVAWISDR